MWTALVCCAIHPRCTLSLQLHFPSMTWQCEQLRMHRQKKPIFPLGVLQFITLAINCHNSPQKPTKIHIASPTDDLADEWWEDSSPPVPPQSHTKLTENCFVRKVLGNFNWQLSNYLLRPQNENRKCSPWRTGPRWWYFISKLSRTLTKTKT